MAINAATAVGRPQNVDPAYAGTSEDELALSKADRLYLLSKQFQLSLFYEIVKAKREHVANPSAERDLLSDVEYGLSTVAQAIDGLLELRESDNLPD